MRLNLTRHHAKATITCPPLRWRVVRRVTLKAGAMAVLFAAVLVLLALSDGWWRHPMAVVGASLMLAWSVAGVLACVHYLRRARQPVVFKVARGELTVTWPFLLARRTRTVRTSDVTAIEVGPARAEMGNGLPAARLVIRRRRRRPIRVPAHHPVTEVTRAAEELRAVLHV